MDEWTIQEVARLAGTTSRALRHYGQLGLVRPTSVGANGMRRYDAAAVRRLQRVLLLRERGLGLAAIGAVLDGTVDEAAALREHLVALRRDRDLLDRRIASIERTITTIDTEETIMADEMLDGFAHEQHREEVVERWGEDAWRRSDAGWRALGAEGQATFRREAEALTAAWIAAHARGVDPASDEALALARRHVDWLAGAPGFAGPPAWEHVLGLGDLYVADERFAANYDGLGGAAFVRDALRALAAREQGRVEGPGRGR